MDRILSLKQVCALNIKSVCIPESFFNWRSMEVLERKLQHYFRLHFKKRPAILANYQDFVLPSPHSLIELVVYSDGSERFKHHHLLPQGLEYRIWVLSQYSKKLLLQNSDIQASRINVIPRYQLFPPRKKQRAFPKVNQPLRLIYAGRIGDHGKNFHLACALTSAIQKAWLAPVEFHICGPNLIPALAAAELSKYAWIMTPKVWNDLGPNWIKKFPIGVLINLSTFVGEDYGVSVAQAQQKGFPVIVSDWGGFKDIQGTNVIKISVKIIQKALESKNLQQQEDHLMKAFIKALDVQ